MVPTSRVSKKLLEPAIHLPSEVDEKVVTATKFIFEKVKEASPGWSGLTRLETLFKSFKEQQQETTANIAEGQRAMESRLVSAERSNMRLESLIKALPAGDSSGGLDFAVRAKKLFDEEVKVALAEQRKEFLGLMEAQDKRHQAEMAQVMEWTKSLEGIIKAMPVPQVNVTNQVSPPEVNPSFNVPSPSVTVQVPEQKSIINVPEQKAADVVVNIPKRSKMKKTFTYDGAGRPYEVIEEEME